jgi:tRNA threonylcarbamoyladenosine biosynthesis protein TsaB
VPGPDLILAIDTAGDACSACVFDAGASRVLAERSEAMQRGHAEALFPMIEAVLGDARLAPADLKAVAATVGPGSLTGVRVGLAAAKGLALSIGRPALGVSTLEALAAPHRGRPVLAVLDARRGELFAAFFGPAGEALAAPAAVTPDGLPPFVGAVRSPGGFVAAGSGAGLAAELLGGLVTECDDAPVPVIADVARLAAARIGAPETAPPSPLYLRGADAKPQLGFALARA